MNRMFIDYLINRPIYYFTYILFTRKLMSHRDIRIVKYGMQVVFSETLKILFLLLCFGTIGKIPEFLLALTILSLTRTYSGGLHFNTFNKCLLFTTAFFVMNIMILPNISIINSSFIFIIIVPLSILFMYLYSPIPSEHRPISSKKLYYKNKIIATVMTVAIYILLYIIPFNEHLKLIGIWTITLQVLQLIIGGIINEKKVIFNE